MLSETSLEQVFRQKYGAPGRLGWGPLTRRRFGYFTPDDLYETILYELVEPSTDWLDVGCGRDIFPSNPVTAQMLADRCNRLTGLDPSPNVNENPLIHERFQGYLEDFRPNYQFDLITMRMVAEHITNPADTIANLARLCKSGARVVVYTVYRWSPIALISSCVPFALHHPIKRMLWRTDEKDTFPTAYKMNTRARLATLFRAADLEEEAFFYLDDCRTFARFKLLSVMELMACKSLRIFGLHYPEVCLAGVYRRR